jgi:hypothetical protein
MEMDGGRRDHRKSQTLKGETRLNRTRENEKDYENENDVRMA